MSDKVIEIIESAFPGVTVKLTGDTPQYDAYNVMDEDYVRFENFIWLKFEDSVSIHALSPEQTKKHRPNYAIKRLEKGSKS